MGSIIERGKSAVGAYQCPPIPPPCPPPPSRNSWATCFSGIGISKLNLIVLDIWISKYIVIWISIALLRSLQFPPVDVIRDDIAVSITDQLNPPVPMQIIELSLLLLGSIKLCGSQNKTNDLPPP